MCITLESLPPRRGSKDYPFDFHEGIGIGSGRVRESFEGDHFAIRHGIMVSVLRPWYTFPIQRYLSFGVQELHRRVTDWELRRGFERA